MGSIYRPDHLGFISKLYINLRWKYHQKLIGKILFHSSQSPDRSWCSGWIQTVRCGVNQFLFITSLFRNLSEISWFAETNFCVQALFTCIMLFTPILQELVCDKNYLLKEGSRKLCINFCQVNKSCFIVTFGTVQIFCIMLKF